MTVHALPATQESQRTEQRYIFRRRGLMTTDDMTTRIRTLDISRQSLGVIGPDPVKVGKSCLIMLDAVLGERIVQLQFSCKAVYCILTGIDGFRTGLYIDDKVESHQQQLQKIIATCASVSLASLN